MPVRPTERIRSATALAGRTVRLRACGLALMPLAIALACWTRLVSAACFGTLAWLASLFALAMFAVFATGPKPVPVRRIRPAIHRARVWFDRLAAKKKTSVVLCGVLVVAIRLAIYPWLGAPEPRALDGFSQLLAAKTFASGHWTMPTHPMWVHFEAPYIIHHPTYASKYPPGPPLMMAAGIWIGGHPWTGVMIAAALMCGAFCWMLQGWLPPRWALAGGLLAVARYSLHHYWLNSYFGGALAAFGGALVLGALPRVLRGSSTFATVVMGAGFAITISARPYEGLLLFLIPGLLIAAWALAGRGRAFKRRMATVVIPAALPVIAAAIPYAYYNYKVTGSALKLPYAVHTDTYEPVPHFVWQEIRPAPRYNHAELARFFEWPGQLLRQRTLSGLGDRLLAILGLDIYANIPTHPKVLTNLIFGVALVLSIPFLFRDRGMRVPLLIFAVMVMGLLPETWHFDHYAAPMAGLTLLLVCQGLRHVAVLRPWRKRLWGAAPLLLAALAAVAVLLYCLVAVRLLVEPPDYVKVDLPRTAAHIGRVPGKHLVLVRYHHGFSLHTADFVYNEPDIDAARIVWARDMGPERNARLLDYFRDRQVWGVCKGDWPARIYRGSACPEGSAPAAPAAAVR